MPLELFVTPEIGFDYALLRQQLIQLGHIGERGTRFGWKSGRLMHVHGTSKSVW